MLKYMLRLFSEQRGDSLSIVYNTPGFSIKGISMIQINSGSSVTLSLQLSADALGNPTAALPGPVVWTVSDVTKATLTPAADGMTATVGGTLAGEFTVTVTSGSLTDTMQCTTVSGVTTGIHIFQA